MESVWAPQAWTAKAQFILLGSVHTVNIFSRQSASTFSRDYNMAVFVAQMGRGLCITHLQGSTWRIRWGKGEEIKKQVKSKVISLCAERELTNGRKEGETGEHVGDRKD